MVVSPGGVVVRLPFPLEIAEHCGGESLDGLRVVVGAGILEGLEVPFGLPFEGLEDGL